MKKQINFISNWSFRGIIVVTILSAMLCTFNAKAGNRPSTALNAVKVEMKSENGFENRKNSNPKTNSTAVEAELELQIEYNAEEFVEAEMALEIGSWMNSNAETNNEAVEAELALKIKYNAKEFVEAEMAFEIASRMNKSCF